MRPFNIITDFVPLNGEIWTTLNWNGMLLHRYSISSMGRLYDHSTKRMVSYSTDKDGYFMASIKVEGVGFKKIRVHRFELLSFRFIPNFMDMQVNHKDGNKQNLLLDNLEWVTPLSNTRHGWDTGLNNNIGVNNGNGKYDDAMIMKICELIDSGYSNADICTAFGVTDKRERMTFNGTISGIRYGKTHRNISVNYNFMKGSNVKNRYSEAFAELVCQFLSDTTRSFSYKEIMDFLNIPNEERKTFKIFIDDLLRGRTCKAVTSKYKLHAPRLDKDEFSYLMR